MSLVEELLQGEARAVAKAISLVENGSEAAQDLMRQIFPATGNATVIGVTGAPGSGKSTLVDQLVVALRSQGKKIGIVAVDPSSPFSGGAILGDRIRMMQHSTDPDVFIRSMATRGHLGGVAGATGSVISVLDAAGKDLILVETVGVGQDEVDVVKLADMVLVVVTPGSGDEIQTFKAGIMEIADIFVINKADSPGADELERQLTAMLDLGLKGREKPAVLKTSAASGEGIAPLCQSLEHWLKDRDPAETEARKKSFIRWLLKDTILSLFFQDVMDDLSETDLSEMIDRIYRRRCDPYSAAEDVLNRIKEA
jgi:LAO/AO transport system kinase